MEVGQVLVRFLRVQGSQDTPSAITLMVSPSYLPENKHKLSMIKHLMPTLCVSASNPQYASGANSRCRIRCSSGPPIRPFKPKCETIGPHKVRFLGIDLR